MAVENAPSSGQTDGVHVFIADNTRMGNELLASALASDERFCVVGSEEKPEKVLAGVRNPVDVVIVSSNLGEPSAGPCFTRRLLAAYPRVRIVMLLERAERDAVVEAFRAGAIGVLCRAQPIEVLGRCVECVHRGEIWADEEAIKFLLEALASLPSPSCPTNGSVCELSGREQSIIRCVAEGLTNRQIAAGLGMNENTLKHCLKHLFEKLHVSTRSELVFEAAAHAGPQIPYPVTPEEHAGSRVDNRAAFEWHSRAAERSDPLALLTVGEMCGEGRGTPRDLVAAYEWFLLAERCSTHIINTSKAYRESLGSEMTEGEIAEAERSASEWLEQHRQKLLMLRASRWDTSPRAKSRGSRLNYRLLA